MIMQAIRNEHPNPRPLYMLGEHWFKGYPGVGMLANKIGLVAAHPANAHRLLHDEGRLVLVFPEGQKGTRKLFWQRYKLRRFGRGGFVKTAIRAGVPIVPVAVMGAEEAMPIFAHVPLLQRLTGLIYFPINHAFPQFGLLAGAMYLPAKFRIRFLEPVRFERYGPDAADDVAFVQQMADDIRARIQDSLNEMLRPPSSRSGSDRVRPLRRRRMGIRARLQGERLAPSRQVAHRRAGCPRRHGALRSRGPAAAVTTRLAARSGPRSRSTSPSNLDEKRHHRLPGRVRCRPDHTAGREPVGRLADPDDRRPAAATLGGSDQPTGHGHRAAPRGAG